MLVFVDHDKYIRVVRAHSEGGVSSRQPVGRVMKNHLEVSEEFRDMLSPEEALEVESALETYRAAAAARSAYYALNFPAIVREVMDRFEAEASDVERQLIMNALSEAMRRMRKYEREVQTA
jgi:hypothetical protein